MLSNEPNNVLIGFVHGDSGVDITIECRGQVVPVGFAGPVAAGVGYVGAVTHATVRCGLLHCLDATIATAAISSGLFTRRPCTVVTR